MAESNLLKDTLEVNYNGETYEFRIPSYVDEIKLGIREKNIRRSIEIELGGDTMGGVEGLDNGTYFMIRTAAIFECLLKSATATWPYGGIDPLLKPKVDYTKWPKDKVNEALNVGAEYNRELSRFRDGGLSDGDATGTEIMASEQNP